MDRKAIPREALAGLTTAFAMVPETVAFAFVAGVGPLTGLYASAIGGVVAALAGGRPAMVSGGAGSLAVVCTAAVARYGPGHLFAAVIGMGLLQILIGLVRGGRLVRLVPYPVVLGFVNGLAIVILLAQLRHLNFDLAHGLAQTATFWATLGLASFTMALVYVLPRLSRAVPSALVAIGTVTILAHLVHAPVQYVGDLASVAGGWPRFALPSSFGPWTEVASLAFVLAGVGLTETLLTQQLVNDLTDTPSNPNRECVGQGLANVASGFFGGMGVCAMIAQTILNVESGGRTRLSGVVEGAAVLAFVVVAGSVIGAVPMAALVGVMIAVVLKTFAWESLRLWGKAPRADVALIGVVTAVTVFTNLLVAVAVGVALAALHHVWNAGRHVRVDRTPDGYRVSGPLFFGSLHALTDALRPDNDPVRTVLDLTDARVQDLSARETLAKLQARYAERGKELVLHRA